MVAFTSTPSLSPENEQALSILLRAVSLSSGRRFSLILAHCNYSPLQMRIMARLQQQAEISIREWTLPPTAQTLYTAIQTEIGHEIPAALSVTALERNQTLDKLLISTNQVRDEFSKNLPCPLVLWVTDDVQAQLVRLAPDFYGWASTISFQLDPAELKGLLSQQTDRMFADALDPASTSSANLLCQQSRAALPTREVEIALSDLQTQNCALDADLDASLKFVLGQADQANRQFQQAIEKYQASLTVWQQANDRERQGILLLHLGGCYLSWGELQSPQDRFHWQTAEQYFQQSLAAFETANRLDLKAKFIGFRGDALKQIQRWEDLQVLVQEAQTLHERYPNAVEQARILGLRTELCLQHSQNYEEAVLCAQKARDLLKKDSDQKLLQGQYALLQAKALQILQQPRAAIAVLRETQLSLFPAEDPHRYIKEDPHLYIQVLEQLRKLHFEQDEYDKAFQFKSARLVVESQYGLRPFIGASRLRSQRQPKPMASRLETVAEEIAVSGRQNDVDLLKDRIARNDTKLTILHGQLGVGKSSLIHAGLIPTLEQESIQARDVLVLPLRSYHNWLDKLGEKLAAKLPAYQSQLPPLPWSESTLLQQLEESEHRNFFIVLIFDQFEEFFVNYPNTEERRAFFQFLSRCLEIPFVNLILSLREDYLHYLLEWERYDDLESIGDDILSRKHRYELANFSLEDTQKIIQVLTKRTQLSLESDLIERFVQDLADEAREVRPIELQVVGAQLHDEKIRTLKQYQKLGENPKEILVQKYLESVIEDCGSENKEAARIILFLLTGENNTRPPKTREELETDLKALEKGLLLEAERLDLVLKILKESGLVFLLPENPADRYQLVHDYLVTFIRKQKLELEKLVKELKEKEIELKIAQLETRNAEGHQTVAEEKRKRIEAEFSLERNRGRTRLIFISILLAVACIANIALFISRRSIVSDEENKLKEQNGYIARLHYRYAKDLLEYKNADDALAEIIYSGTLFGSSSNILLDNSQETHREIISIFQESAKKAILQKGYLLTKREEALIKKRTDILTTEEMKVLLRDLVELGCKHLRQNAKGVFEARIDEGWCPKISV